MREHARNRHRAPEKSPSSFCGNTDHARPALNVANHNRIWADYRMRSDSHRPQKLSACSDIDVAFNYREAGSLPRNSDRHLLMDQAIHSNHGVRMNHDAIWMGKK
jgi:hypothetical protein